MSELKTDNNRLSVWVVEDDNDLDDAFIALGSNCEHIGTVTAVSICPEDLKDIEIEAVEGLTPTIGINEKHRDIMNLTYCSLGTVIKSIIVGLNKGKYYRKNKAKMKELLVEAYKNNKLDIENMSSSLRDEILSNA